MNLVIHIFLLANGSVRMPATKKKLKWEVPDNGFLLPPSQDL